MFSMKLELELNELCPINIKPPRFAAWTKLPVTMLPAPLELPDGTVNATSKLLRLLTSGRLTQPVPKQVADAVTKLVPVSRPAVVTPLSKFPPDKPIVIFIKSALADGTSARLANSRAGRIRRNRNLLGSMGTHPGSFHSNALRISRSYSKL
jgi:hypothetical protein